MAFISRTMRRWTAGGVFAAAGALAVVLALALAGLGIGLAGGPAAFRDWMHSITPYALLWRLALYAAGGALYFSRWRPRLRALQREHSDGGAAAHARLVKFERLCLIALAAIEAANLPGLIGWVLG